MSTDINKAAIRQYVDAFNRGDWQTMQKLFADDAVVYGVLGWGRLNDVLPTWIRLHEALQMKLEVVDLVAEGHSVALRLNESGRAVGQFFHHPATGKTYEAVAMEWFELRNGLITRRWGARDSAGIYRQLGYTA
ncbi:conserved hypothetical protein, steroid delta-isomerase-related [Andreprevotia lacus DSM 23236]|jgi:steroid delta-isomerase-like uncharacterized protein|uniref:SnoaL-like polyketide cyclase n=1 Tax=Andreprevotia lacus DSM 23236 TaxID=1121001 RepID=A0A1W1X5D7_9NEIS|nr:ester cyclase [Andreprevotia lacus]SMC19122.1 conserved hypothetical protein, steroid delta-isomerase-related [Andreprevotia lacus DSM 23236]